MQKGLIAIGFLVVIAVIVALLRFAGFEHNPVIVCMVAWTVLWLGVSQAQRLHVSVGSEAQKVSGQSGPRFWLIRSVALVLSLLLGLTVYTQYLVRQYELPEVYQWQAMAWVMGNNRPLPTLVEIPAGSFEMGGEFEQPIHTVTISKPFFMAETETTFVQYDYFVWQMKRAGFEGSQYPEDEDWGRTTRPVINVDWEASQAYIHWLNQYFQKDMSCRLPSEAEWEYAARAGTKTTFYWGDDANRDYANYGEEGLLARSSRITGKSYDIDISADKWPNTAPVKQLAPNKFGLYDMSGNVYERVQDTWHDDYKAAPDDGSAWESGSSDFHVLRGGSWLSTSNDVRSAHRNRSHGVVGLNFIGFRVVCSPIEH